MELRHNGTAQLESERLILKRIEVADATQMLLNFASDDRVSRYMSWDSFKSTSEMEKWLEEWQEEYKKDDTYYWGLYLKSDNSLIGTVYLLTENEEQKLGSLSYCLGYSWWGHEYMYEALNQVMRYSFDIIGFEKLEAYYAKSNNQSARVLQKIGMQLDRKLADYTKTHNGLEDAIFYSIFKDEY